MCVSLGNLWSCIKTLEYEMQKIIRNFGISDHFYFKCCIDFYEFWREVKE